MGMKIWKKREEGSGSSSSFDTLREPFHLLTTTLLGLLLPLSFLLLARFSTAYYLMALNAYPTMSTSPPSLIFSLFIYANPVNPLHALVSALSVAALVHGLSSGRNNSSTILRDMLPKSGQRSRLYAAWIMLCMLQVCVGLGIEGSIGAGIDGSGFGVRGRSLVCRLIFFLGLHETMLYWLRTVVKPVVDDTVFGYAKEERWVERVVIAVSFGSLWWWRLRDEVESLVVVVELTGEMDMAVGVAAFLGWWLYYLTVTIGMVRVVKGLIWFAMILLCERVQLPNAGELEAEEKV